MSSDETQKPQRIKVSKRVREFGEWTIRDSLGNVQEFINDLVDEYGTDAIIQRVYDEYDDSVSYGVFADRDETDDEYAKRCKMIEQQQERDRQQYLALKKRFGD